MDRKPHVTVDDDAAFTRLDVVMMAISSFIEWLVIGPAIHLLYHLRRMRA